MLTGATLQCRKLWGVESRRRSSGLKRSLCSAFGQSIRRSSGSSDSNASIAYLQRWAGTGASRAAASVKEAPPAPSHSPPSSTSSPQPLPVFGRSYLIPTIKLSRGDADSVEVLTTKLKQKNTQLRGFFGENSPVVVDLCGVSPDGSPHGSTVDDHTIHNILEALKSVQIVPVGVFASSPEVREAAAAHGLPPLMLSHSQQQQQQQATVATGDSELPGQHRASSQKEVNGDFSKEVDGRKKLYSAPPRPPVAAAAAAAAASERASASASLSPPPPPPPPPHPPTKAGAPQTLVHSGNVRSGDQLYAEGGSLVVLGSVSSGGEVLADANIYIYGALRGRALAGLSGSAEARIFATRFDPELVSIGDAFTTGDKLSETERDGPRQVALVGNTLVTKPLAC